MDSSPSLAHASLPPPPAPGSVSDAVEATHRFVTALVERDYEAIEAQLDADVCCWWTRGGRLSLVEGGPALAHALVHLIDHEPPTRLDIRTPSAATSVTSWLVGDALRWSLELVVAHDRIVGAYVRGPQLEDTSSFLSPSVRR